MTNTAPTQPKETAMLYPYDWEVEVPELVEVPTDPFLLTELAELNDQVPVAS